MKEEIDTFDFVEVVFCFAGIFEEYINQYQEYKQQGIDMAVSKGETGNNPECDMVDYKELPLPSLLEKQSDLLCEFIINSSEDEKKAMNVVVDDSLDYLKELNYQNSDIRIIKSRLKKIIQHSGELKTIKCKDDLMSCYELWELSKLCLEYNIERPREFIPADEQIKLKLNDNFGYGNELFDNNDYVDFIDIVYKYFGIDKLLNEIIKIYINANKKDKELTRPTELIHYDDLRDKLSDRTLSNPSTLKADYNALIDLVKGHTYKCYKKPVEFLNIAEKILKQLAGDIFNKKCKQIALINKREVKDKINLYTLSEWRDKLRKKIKKSNGTLSFSGLTNKELKRYKVLFNDKYEVNVESIDNAVLIAERTMKKLIQAQDEYFKEPKLNERKLRELEKYIAKEEGQYFEAKVGVISWEQQSTEINTFTTETSIDAKEEGKKQSEPQQKTEANSKNNPRDLIVVVNINASIINTNNKIYHFNDVFGKSNDAKNIFLAFVLRNGILTEHKLTLLLPGRNKDAKKTAVSKMNTRLKKSLNLLTDSNHNPFQKKNGEYYTIFKELRTSKGKKKDAMNYLSYDEHALEKASLEQFNNNFDEEDDPAGKFIKTK